jgi:hypothetical protein
MELALRFTKQSCANGRRGETAADLTVGWGNARC